MNLYDFLAGMSPDELDQVIETCERLKNEIEEKEGILQEFRDPPFIEPIKVPTIARDF